MGLPRRLDQRFKGRVALQLSSLDALFQLLDQSSDGGAWRDVEGVGEGGAESPGEGDATLILFLEARDSLCEVLQRCRDSALTGSSSCRVVRA